jgi:hypothetical protein
MRSFATLLAGAASLLAAIAAAAPAHAIPRTFVSGTGGGAVCSRAAPCATFQAAHDATDPGGEINCIDAGEFGSLGISKSITVDCAGTLGAALVSGILVIADGVTVRLRNLTIRGPEGLDQAALTFGNGVAIFVENCVITRSSGAGIAIFPNAVNAKLFVSDTIISGNTTHGIVMQPFGTGSVRALVDGVRVEKNGSEGVRADGSAGTGLVAAQIRNSVISGNGTGLRSLAAAGATVAVTVDRSSLTLSTADGVRASSPAFVLIGRSTVMSNVAGLNGSSILSYQNNHLTGNVSDGAPTGVLTMR